MALRSVGAEVKYTFRTLLRLAGLPYEFVWVESPNASKDLDIYYGPSIGDPQAAVAITWSGKDFADGSRLEPLGCGEHEGLALLDFGEGHPALWSCGEEKLRFSSDIIFACYWLLTGAGESHYPRDRWDNVSLQGSFLLEHSMLSKPLVSNYGSLLRKHFGRLGYRPQNFPWCSSSAAAAFVFSHDVDYPEMIRWIECLRLLGRRGIRGLRSIYGVVRGANHFWKFSDWVEYEKALGTRPAFYFMSRKGSLWDYATGTPDAFYDIQSPQFRELFDVLRKEGCEMGLHASYHAYRSTEQIRREKQALEEATGVQVEGNRHHFWHLDPAAPHETLRRQEHAGLHYDSSLAFEFYPGFRRGICHPFRPFDPIERRELNLLELPPAWMDDHFDRRLTKNKITDPEASARHLVEAARASGGIVVVDYHTRGMNSDFFPQYGRWLMDFVRRHLDSTVTFVTPCEIARLYSEYEKVLAADSLDRAEVSREAVDVGSAALAHAPLSKVKSASSIDLLRQDESTIWDAFVEAHPDGHIYHTLAWKAVVEEGFGHRAYYLRAADSEGQITGVLPLFLVKGIFGRRLVSVPMRDRGGVLARDPQVASLLVGRAIELTHEMRCGYLELRSLTEMGAAVSKEHALRCENKWVTTRVDLSPSVEQLWKALDRDAVRWAIRKAIKEGVRLEIDNTERGMERFYEMFVRTRSRMGIPPFSQRLFQAIWRHFVARGKANLFVVYKDIQPIHAMVNFFSKDTFIPGYAAPQDLWRKYYPNEFMFWHTIEWAAQQGFRHYDFGADSHRQTGLLWFKKKWGGVHTPMFYYYHLNATGRAPDLDSSSSSYSLARKVWAHLPIAVSRSLGGWVTRQLS